ncbi:MAG: hypothetical protein DGJ47_000586 [Rickettsiaceae bacterium]
MLSDKKNLSNIEKKEVLQKDYDQCFDLLQAAYIEARYDKNYKITTEHLEYLIERITKLKEVTKRICQDKINTYR